MVWTWQKIYKGTEEQHQKGTEEQHQKGTEEQHQKESTTEHQCYREMLYPGLCKWRYWQYFFFFRDIWRYEAQGPNPTHALYLNCTKYILYFLILNHYLIKYRRNGLEPCKAECVNLLSLQEIELEYFLALL